jgi:hypothetical protein
MVNHQDLINYSTKVGAVIYDKGCEKITTKFKMKSSGTIVYTTKLRQVCQDGVAHGHPVNHQLYQRRWLYHQHHPSVWTDQCGHASGLV